MVAPPTQRDQLRFPPAEWLVTIGVLLLVGAVALGVRLQDLVGPTHLDSVASHELFGRGGHDVADQQAWKDVVSLGGFQALIVVSALLAWWAWRRRDLTGVVVAIVAPMVTVGGVEYLAKPLIERRTPSGGLLYPSGHVAAGAALATVAVLLVYRYAGPKVALLLTPAGAVAAGVIAVGVLVLHWHYLTDTVGGAAIGIGVVLCFAGAADAVAPRGDRGRPAVVTSSRLQ